MLHQHFFSDEVCLCLSLKSVHLTAGFQAEFGAGAEAEFQFSAAGGGGRGAEKEG